MHKKPELPVSIKRKISFIGSYSKRRENIIGAINSSFPVEIWGWGWGRSKLSVKKNIKIHHYVLSQADYAREIPQSLINLNILTVENNDLVNLRIFETTASFGLLLTEHNSYTESLLKDGCIYYDAESVQDLNDKIASVFNEENAEWVNSVKEKGYDIIINGQNSINDRVDQVLAALVTTKQAAEEIRPTVSN